MLGILTLMGSGGGLKGNVWVKEVWVKGIDLIGEMRPTVRGGRFLFDE